jgi:hypothetical protein
MLEIVFCLLMAKQAGDFFIEGTIDDLTYYKMEGKYYVRMKSSLTGKKFWKRKAFERSRQSCKRFSEGNKLASKLYRMIREEKRVCKLFCFLKKRAIQLLKDGKTSSEAEEMLMDHLMEFGMNGKTGSTKCTKKVREDTRLLVVKEEDMFCCSWLHNIGMCS